MYVFEIEKEIKNELNRIKQVVPFIPKEIFLHKRAENKWSRKEIIGHLIDSASYNLKRFNEIQIDEGVYEVTSYPQDELVKTNDYQYLDLKSLLTLIEALNTQIIQVVKHINPKDYSKAILAYDEQKDLQWLIEDYVEHLRYHTNQIVDTEGISLEEIPVHITLEKARAQLKTSPDEFIKLLEFSDLEIEFYQPQGLDKQTPHERDELYIISSGSGTFVLEDKEIPIQTHDVLFVKAHEDHRFINFTSDFSTWVIFYGLNR